MSDIEARVKKIIAEQLGVEESQVTNEKAFVADLGAHLLDKVEDRLQLGLRELDGPDHDVFGQLVGARLDHQHGVTGGGNGQLERRPL